MQYGLQDILLQRLPRILRIGKENNHNGVAQLESLDKVILHGDSQKARRYAGSGTATLSSNQKKPIGCAVVFGDRVMTLLRGWAQHEKDLQNGSALTAKLFGGPICENLSCNFASSNTTHFNRKATKYLMYQNSGKGRKDGMKNLWIGMRGLTVMSLAFSSGLGFDPWADVIDRNSKPFIQTTNITQNSIFDPQFVPTLPLCHPTYLSSLKVIARKRTSSYNSQNAHLSISPESTAPQDLRIINTSSQLHHHPPTRTKTSPNNLPAMQ
jgi:hypothetical protein